MKASVSQQQISHLNSSSNNSQQQQTAALNIQQSSNQRSHSQAMKRFSSEVGPVVQLRGQSGGGLVDEAGANSADEFNNSSIASTPDTIYYFKLKSAAFVPSTSFTATGGNYSTSFGNLNHGESTSDLPPFITLLSNELGSLTPFSHNTTVNNQQMLQHGGDQMLVMAQSPPPPNNIITEHGSGQLSRAKNLKYISDTEMASPCSLPNFKLLDNLMGHNSNPLINNLAGGSNATPAPDDFVLIEPVS
jgi:hypothetical protein